MARNMRLVYDDGKTTQSKLDEILDYYGGHPDTHVPLGVDDRGTVAVSAESLWVLSQTVSQVLDGNPRVTEMVGASMPMEWVHGAMDALMILGIPFDGETAWVDPDAMSD